MNFTVEITPQGVITAAAFVAAVIALMGYVFKSRDWIKKQDKQDAENKADITALEKHHNEDIAVIKDELQLLTYGVLACLKGLKEQGCNGPVTEAINKIDKHLNERAHH